MNIIIAGTAYPLRGGIAHFNALLARHLGKRHNVETITFKRQYPTFLFPGKSQEEPGEVGGQLARRSPPADRSPSADVGPKEEVGRSEISGSAGTIDIKPAPQLIDSINPLNWVRVARKIRKRKPDLLIFKYWLPFFGPCFGTIARLAKRGTSTKVLFICDNVVPHEPRPGDVPFTKYAFKQADYFIVQSDTVERDLLRFVPHAKYRKAPHPVYEIFGELLPKDDARQTLGISARKVILYFGYIRPYKGLTVLIDAMRELDDLLLLAVGEFYDDESKYRKKVEDLNLSSRIRFVSDYVPNDQVRLYFSAADLVVLPYLSATQSGITQIAYNFDKPVIATNVGGLAEVVVHEKTGFIVPPNNPGALAAAIRKFYAENKEGVFSANVKLEKKKYSWENFVLHIEELVS